MVDIPNQFLFLLRTLLKPNICQLPNRFKQILSNLGAVIEAGFVSIWPTEEQTPYETAAKGASNMNNFGKNLMGGLLGAIYLMCFAFPIGLLLDVFRDKMPIGQFLGNQIITFLAVWFIGYFVVQMYRELLANANKPRRDDNDANANDPNNSDAGNSDASNNVNGGGKQNKNIIDSSKTGDPTDTTDATNSADVTNDKK